MRGHAARDCRLGAVPSVVRYEADGWGVGELWVEGERVLWSELPRPGPPASGSHPVAERLSAYFAGERASFDDVELELDWATPFQRSVSEALRRVAYGETVTYGELAALAGHPNAQRAAGTFCAHNRFAIIVPCHRVVASNGLGSYGSLGQDYKRRLLELEHVAL
jgi:methylated-DNA-[protein]-cysteine S-methyltransferase